jgi:hypothetical protein
VGKSAKNEILKIRAAFFNNIAVGAFVAGAAIPYFSLFPKIASETGSFSSFVGDWRKLTVIAAGFVAALLASFYLHSHAQRILSEIED